ncbi:MAG: protein kinase [bacterium]|nr:MAG: protein kinase [bacterium]
MIGKTISHYEILEKLGEGGMGVVYKARDTKLDRPVAIKFLPPHLSQNEEAKKRFVQEAKAASALDHPNICTIYEIDEIPEGQIFIVMAHYEGETLEDRVKEGGIDVEEACDVVEAIAGGLAEAHARGIIHRDIKSSNILITEGGRVKIIDFGLAKLAEQSHLTRVGTTLGTVKYMSPEQARGDEIDHRTDIWSTGVLLYETITGRKPFRGNYDQAIIYSILNDEPPGIKILRPEAPAAVEKIIQKTLAKYPEKRYQQIEDLAADLRSVREAARKKTAAGLPDREKRSIAVLPFVDMSPQKDQEYFCDGLAEELINALAHIKPLRVVARTSAFSFKGGKYDVREIGEKLNVDTVLEGSIRKAGERLRITAQLVSAADGYHLWSEKYDRKLEDIFAIQDEISLAIVDKLKMELLGEEAARLVKRGTENLEAYDLYMRGRFFWEKRGLNVKKAIEYFEQAIEKDPSYAEAYAGIADSYYILSFYGYLPSREAIPIARENALKALEINDTIAEAHSALGMIYQYHDWDGSAAERKFRRALELNPNYSPAHYWYAAMLSLTDRDEEMLRENERAIEVDPLSVQAHTMHGWCLLGRLKLDQAEEKLKRALELNPDFVLAHWLLGQTYCLMSKDDEAIAELRKAVELSSRNPWILSTLGFVYGKMGRTAEAREVLTELRERSDHEYVQSYYFAYVHAGLGELEETLTWLEKAYEAHEQWLIVIGAFGVMEPGFKTFQDDPRFQAFIRKIRASMR